jgi:hypothetical protein
MCGFVGRITREDFAESESKVAWWLAGSQAESQQDEGW